MGSSASTGAPGSAISIHSASPSVSVRATSRSLSSAERAPARPACPPSPAARSPGGRARAPRSETDGRDGRSGGHRDPDAIVLVDVHLDEVAGTVRGQAGHEQQVEVAPQLIDRDVEEAGHLRQLAPGMLHQVRHDHEHPSEPFGGLGRPTPGFGPRGLSQGAPPAAPRPDRGASADPRRRRPVRAGSGSVPARVRRPAAR